MLQHVLRFLALDFAINPAPLTAAPAGFGRSQALTTT